MLRHMVGIQRTLAESPTRFKPLLYLPETNKPWRKRVTECTESVLDVFLGENLAVGRIITD